MSEAEEYKARLSGVFSRASSAYGNVGPGAEMFSYFGEGLVDFAGLPTGVRVLDVACGRGAVLFPAASAVSSGGHVIGIDISEGMIELTGKELSSQGIENAQVIEMDAETLEFPDASFDYVLCGLSLFFFPNLDRALAEVLRVLKVGGRFATSTFQEMEDSLLSILWELHGSVKDRLQPVPSVETKQLDREDELRLSLSESGFCDIEIVSDELTLYCGGGEEWWQFLWSGGTRGYFERMDTETLADYKKEAIRLALERETEQGIPNQFRVFFAKGHKP